MTRHFERQRRYELFTLSSTNTQSRCFVHTPEDRHHHHDHCGIAAGESIAAGEGCHVVAPPRRQHAPRGLQSDGWNCFVAGPATSSVDDQVGDATCSQEAG